MTKAIEAAIATCEAHYERPLKNWEMTALQAAITAFLANTDGGEIVERLRKWDRCWPGNVNIERMVDDAADHITKLTAQLTGAIADGYDLAKEEYRERIAELEAALTSLVELNKSYASFGGELYQDRIDRAWDIAARALTKQGGGQ